MPTTEPSRCSRVIVRCARVGRSVPGRASERPLRPSPGIRYFSSRWAMRAVRPLTVWKPNSINTNPIEFSHNSRKRFVGNDSGQSGPSDDNRLLDNGLRSISSAIAARL